MPVDVPWSAPNAGKGPPRKCRSESEYRCGIGPTPRCSRRTTATITAASRRAARRRQTSRTEPSPSSSGEDPNSEIRRTLSAGATGASLMTPSALKTDCSSSGEWRTRCRDGRNRRPSAQHFSPHRRAGHSRTRRTWASRRRRWRPIELENPEDDGARSRRRTRRCRGRGTPSVARRARRRCGSTRPSRRFCVALGGGNSMGCTSSRSLSGLVSSHERIGLEGATTARSTTGCVRLFRHADDAKHGTVSGLKRGTVIRDVRASVPPVTAPLVWDPDTRAWHSDRAGQTTETQQVAQRCTGRGGHRRADPRWRETQGPLGRTTTCAPEQDQDRSGECRSDAPAQRPRRQAGMH